MAGLNVEGALSALCCCLTATLQALAQFARLCPGLTTVELDGCFRVSDDEMAAFVKNLRPLERFALHNSMKVGAATAAAINGRSEGTVC